MGDDIRILNMNLRIRPLLLICLIGFILLFSNFLSFKGFGFWDSAIVSDATILNVTHPTDLEQEDDTLASFVKHKKPHSSGFKHDERLFNSLISSRFDKDSCLSRYQVASYRKESPYTPSSYLISRLRRYEALHQRCGPYTNSYNRTVANLRSGKKTREKTDCNYLVLLSYSGLGNRMISMASAFLYALLTDRVLLVDRGVSLNDLFCEPFPETSWLLPLDFPIFFQIKHLTQNSTECFGNMLKTQMNSSSTSLPKQKKKKKKNSSSTSLYVFLYLVSRNRDHDKLFFCDQEQSILQNFTWAIMQSDSYFIPSLFLMPSFEQELHTLFPEKETVFHFLSTYLFVPANPVWELITRYYNSYLAQADERIGIQLRIFNIKHRQFQNLLDQILACSIDNKLLPEINPNESFVASQQNQKSKAVLFTSLFSGYSEKIRDMYREHATVTGEVIEVFQPSHDEHQQYNNIMHDRKAWAEMYLLSLTDKLITSGWSTFGYVAQSLGGLKPWILCQITNWNPKIRNPACTRAMSIEPCFHFPPFFDCKRRNWTDTGAVVPYIRHCEDMPQGVKLVNPTDDIEV